MLSMFADDTHLRYKFETVEEMDLNWYFSNRNKLNSNALSILLKDILLF